MTNSVFMLDYQTITHPRRALIVSYIPVTLLILFTKTTYFGLKSHTSLLCSKLKKSSMNVQMHSIYETIGKKYPDDLLFSREILKCTSNGHFTIP